jgi:hypothetical protein
MQRFWRVIHNIVDDLQITNTVQHTSSTISFTISLTPASKLRLLAHVLP